MSDNDSAAEDLDTPVATPLLRIVGGNPSDEDVAVLVAVLSTAGGSDASGPPAPQDLWGTPADRLRPSTPQAPSTFVNLRFGY